MRLVYRMSVQESYGLDDISSAMRCVDDEQVQTFQDSSLALEMLTGAL